ncbi:MAG TPA: sugar ABC transporter substrate-binding protein [Firmicutes bacterium]|nr:sugar ABC transporter substrate-binding protein [Bacillota bacterium]
MKKLIWLCLIFVMISSVCLASPGKKETVTFWMGAITPERTQAWKEIIASFEKKNPDIKVDFLGVPGDYSAYKQKLDVAIAAGMEPDVSAQCYADYIARGVYEPLDKYVEHWKDKKYFPETAFDSVRAEDAKEHKLYGMPSSTNVRVIWIRPDWFKQAHLKVFKTWDELFEDIPKLTDKSKGRYGWSIRGGAASGETIEQLMYSYSGITDYFTSNGKCTVNNPLHVKFVEKYLGLYKQYTPEDDLTKGWAQLAAGFQSGKCAMVYHNLGSASSHAQAFNNDFSKFMAVNLPLSVKGYRVHNALFSPGYSIHKSSKHKQAAWKFVSFIVTKEASSSYAKVVGDIPLDSRDTQAGWVKERPWIKTGQELLASPQTKYYKTPYYLPQWKSILEKEVDPMVQMVMMKQMTPKEMLDKWAKMMEKAKTDYDASVK